MACDVPNSTPCTSTVSVDIEKVQPRIVSRPSKSVSRCNAGRLNPAISSFMKYACVSNLLETVLATLEAVDEINTKVAMMHGQQIAVKMRYCNHEVEVIA